MNLSEILHRAAALYENRVCGSIVCCNDAYDDDYDDKNDDDERRSLTRSLFSSYRLTYREAYQAQQAHAQWLLLRTTCCCEVCLMDCPTTTTTTTTTTSNCTHHHHHYNRWIVAYLSSNQLDLILSVLSCSSCYNNHRMSRPSGCAQGRRPPPKLVPALLNTRWTVPEIVAALQPSQSSYNHTTTTTNNNNTTTNKHHNDPILLVYQQENDHYKDIAQRVTAALLSDHQNRCYCLPLPTFAQSKLQWLLQSQSSAVMTAHDDVVVDVDDSDSIAQQIRDEMNRLCSRSKLARRRRGTKSEQNNDDDTVDEEEEEEKEDALILFTSGTTQTTGAKGVRLSARALMVQALAKLFPPCSISHTTCLLASTLPFFHVGGVSSILATIWAGGCLCWMTKTTTTASMNQQKPYPHHFVSNNFKKSMIGHASFDPCEVLRSIRMAGVNTLLLVPAMLHALQAHVVVVWEEDTSSSSSSTTHRHYHSTTKTTIAMANYHVDLILMGGQSARAELLDFCRNTFPHARLVQTYACTEAASSLTFRDVTTTTTTRAVVESSSSSDKWGVLPAAAAAATKEDTLSLSLSKSIMPLHLKGDCVGHPPDHVELILVPYNKETGSLLLLLSSGDGNDDSHNNQYNDSNIRKRNAELDSKHSPFMSIPESLWIRQPFTVGVIATRGPHVMNGYWSTKASRISSSIDSYTRQHPVTKEGREALVEDPPWFVSNDLGFWDDQTGALWFAGRLVDSIRTGGETVQANEVERILQMHPRITDVAVFGILDDQLGHAVAAALVVNAPNGKTSSPCATASTTASKAADADAADSDNDNAADSDNDNAPDHSTNPSVWLKHLRRWCAQHGLAGYKSPRHIFLVTSLPKNSNGKTLKYRLVERFSDSSSSSSSKSKL